MFGSVGIVGGGKGAASKHENLVCVCVRKNNKKNSLANTNET